MSVLFLASGCASALLDGNEMHHAYFSAKGFISVEFWKRPDGSYLFTATAEATRSDKDVFDAWHTFVAQVGRGRLAEGAPTIQEYDYKQGYTMFQPYAMGQLRRGKKASGVVRFIGEIPSTTSASQSPKTTP